MKDRLLEILDAQLGKVLLLLSLLLSAWILYANWAVEMPARLTTEVKPRDLYVELEPGVLSQASDETYYAAGPGESYRLGSRFVFVAPIVASIFIPVELDIPALTVMRPPMILPEPGPSLEGADKLPRFGEEFAPPSAADLPPSVKKQP